MGANLCDYRAYGFKLAEKKSIMVYHCDKLMKYINEIWIL